MGKLPKSTLEKKKKPPPHPRTPAPCVGVESHCWGSRQALSVAAYLIKGGREIPWSNDNALICSCQCRTMLWRSQQPSSVRTKLVVPIRPRWRSGPRHRSEGCAGGRAGWGGPAGSLPTAAPGEGTGCPPGAQPLTAPLLGKKQTEERDRVARKRSFWKLGITWRERRAERVVPSAEMSGVKAGRWPMLGGRSSNPSMSCCWRGDQRLSAEPALYKVTKLNAKALGNKRNSKMSKNKEV